MERLTESALRCDNKVISGAELIGLEGEVCEKVCHAREDIGCDGCPIRDAIKRLADYEDTGMEPEEIEAREEKIKQDFHKYIENQSKYDPSYEDTMCVAMELYYQIFGVSYGKATKTARGQ